MKYEYTSTSELKAQRDAIDREIQRRVRKYFVEQTIESLTENIDDITGVAIDRSYHGGKTITFEINGGA